MFGPIIHGETVTLRPPSAEMIPLYLQWLADMEVTRYLNLMYPPSVEMEREWLDRVSRSDSDVVWTIAVEGRPIGSIALHAIDWKDRHAITGIMIGERAEWGKGYASEAMRLRTRFAFEDLGLQKLMTEVIAENRGSIRALEKAGYKQCGVRRRHRFRHGRWYDVWLAEVLHEEWASTNTRPA